MIDGAGVQVSHGSRSLRSQYALSSCLKMSRKVLKIM